jgi:hypothetical protein
MVEELTIQIPIGLDPLQRERRFARPLANALRRSGKLGTVVGGGTQLWGPGLRPVRCDVEVDVLDVARALPVIRDVLVRAQAPPGTTVRFTDSGEVLLAIQETAITLHLPPDLAHRDHRGSVWREGELLGYRLPPSNLCTLLHALNETGQPSFRVIDWVGAELPSEAAMRQLVEAPPTRWAVSQAVVAGNYLARDVDLGRVFCAGILINPDVSFRRLNGAGHFWTWEEFDTFLRQFFGLIPVDEATRRRLDSGR